MSKSADIAKEIEALKEKLYVALQEEAQLKELGLYKRVAIEMHSLLCRANHTDGCGWEYASIYKEDTWRHNEHKHYLQKAQATVEALRNACPHGLTDSTVLEMIEAMFAQMKGW